jgi:preprotein translocase subunit SecA
MAPLYQFFNISPSVVLEDLAALEKCVAYRADVVYVASANLAFDSLRKHSAMSAESDYPIPFNSVIIDEVDNVLLDQGATQHQLVQPVLFDVQLFYRFSSYATRFTLGTDFTLNYVQMTVEFTASGYVLVDQIAITAATDVHEARYYCKSILAAHHLYKRDTDYLVSQNAVVVIDKLSGRPRPGSAFSFGIQQAIEIKEGVPCTYPRTATNSITLQGLYRQFKSRCGMSGSAVHNALEFRFSYSLSVVPVPPHLPSIRTDFPDVVYGTKAEAVTALFDGSADPDVTNLSLRELRDTGRPVLIGTTTIEDAENVSRQCAARGIDHRLLTARNHAEEAAIISEAGQAGRVTIVARMAGRGVDIVLDAASRAAGGLHVIGLGRQEDRRLDEQLRGRCGRQGDPGSSQFVISLEDDLMKAHGAERIKKMMIRLGLQAGVPIEHRMVTRAIKRAQLRLTLNSFYARQLNTQFDRFSEVHRWPLFADRRRLLYISDLSGEADALFARYVARLRATPSAALAAAIGDIEERLSLRVPPSLAGLASTQPDAFADALLGLIRSAYERRRAAAGRYAPARERVILLRSFDLTWSLFQDSLQGKLQGMYLAIRATSTFELQRELTAFFADTERMLREELDNRAIYHLMRIEDAHAVQEIKYWRGIGLFVGETGSGALEDDGVPPPSVAPRIPSTPAPAPSPAIGLPSPSPIALPAVSMWSHLSSYEGHLRKDNVDAARIERVVAVLRNFRVFIGNDQLAAEAVSNRLPAYLDSLALRGIPFWVRRAERRIIWEYFRFLKEQHLLVGKVALTFKDSTARRMRSLGTLLSQPMFWLQLAFLSAFYVVYRALALWPIPGVVAALQPGLQERLAESQVVALLDPLFFGGSLTGLTLAIAGPLSFLSAAAVGRLVHREASMVPLVFGLPLALVWTMLVTIVLTSPLVAVEPLPPSFRLTVALAVGASTFALTTLMWLGQFADLGSPLSLVLLMNGLIVVSAFVTGSAEQPPAIAAGLGGVLLLCMIFSLYRRSSRVSLRLVRVGEFDLKSGEMTRKAVDFYADTLGSGLQYVYALLVVAAVAYWLDRAAAWLPAIDRAPGDLWNHWRLVVYPILVCAFAYLQGIRPFRRSNFTTFLNQRDLFVQGAKNTDAGVSAVRATAKAVLVRNWIFEILLISLAAGLVVMRTRSLDPSLDETLLVIVTLSLTSSLMLLTIGRRLMSHFSAYGATPALSIPATLDQELDEEWLSRVYRWIQQPGGIVAFLIGLVGLYDLLARAWKGIVWLYQRLS